MRKHTPLPRAGIDSAVGPDKAKGLIKSGGLVQRGGGEAPGAVGRLHALQCSRSSSPSLGSTSMRAFMVVSWCVSMYSRKRPDSLVKANACSSGAGAVPCPRVQSGWHPHSHPWRYIMVVFRSSSESLSWPVRSQVGQASVHHNQDDDASLPGVLDGLIHGGVIARAVVEMSALAGPKHSVRAAPKGGGFVLTIRSAGAG